MVPLLLAGTFFLALGSHLVSPIREPEFFFRLTVGHWIESNGTVPSKDLWTLAGSSAPWSAPGWLFDLSLSFLERIGGHTAFIWTKLLLFCLLLGLLQRLFFRLCRDRFFAGLVTTLVGAGLLVDGELLPSLLGWILFPLIAEQICRFRAGKTSSAVLTAGLSILLTNLTGSPFLLAFIFVLSWFVEDPSSEKTRLETDRDGPGTSAVPIILGAIWLAASIATPYLFKGLLGAGLQLAGEIDTALRFRAHPATVFEYRTAFVVLLWLLFAGLKQDSRTGRPSPLVVIAALASVAGAVSISAMPYAIVAAGFCVARSWGEGSQRNEPGMRDGLERLGSSIYRLSPAGLVWLLSCASVVNIVHAVKVPTNTFVLPGPAIDFVLDRKLPFPLFHERSVGYYLAYRFAEPSGAPRFLAMADDRAAIFDRGIVAGDETVNHLTLGWEQYFDRYAPQTVLCRIASPLFSALKRDPQWTQGFDALHALDRPRIPESEGGAPEQVEERLRPYLWAVFLRKDSINSSSGTGESAPGNTEVTR